MAEQRIPPEREDSSLPRRSIESAEDGVDTSTSGVDGEATEYQNGSAPGPKTSLPEHRISWPTYLSTFWLQNKGVFLVLLAQLFAAFMNVMTRLLERNGPHGEGMHTFQVRYSSTTS